MKFVVSRNDLLEKLQLINGVISSSNVLPILENFLFKIEDNVMTITGSDLETTMSTTLEVDAKENTKFAVRAGILVDTVKNLPDQPLTFTVDEKNYSVEITTANGKFKIAGENPEEFPAVPKPENVSSATIASDILLRSIKNTLFAVGQDEIKIALGGVYMQLEEDKTTFVATDAHKLVRLIRTDVGSESTGSFIVPKKSMGLLKNALPGESKPVQISFNQQFAFFSHDDFSMVCRLIDERYPDYNSVIPYDNNNIMTIGRKDLLSSLKRISIFASKSTNQVIFKITGNELQLSAEDVDFSNQATEKLTCSHEGEDIEIAFNVLFLIEMLSVLDSDEVQLRLSTPSRAGILEPTEQKENEDLLMLLMPIMIIH